MYEAGCTPPPKFSRVLLGVFAFPSWVFHTTPQKFQKLSFVFTVRHTVQSSLIHMKTSLFGNALQSGRIWKADFAFWCAGKTFWKRSYLKTWRQDHGNHVISLFEVFSNTNSKWSVIVAFSNFSGEVCIFGKHFMRFKFAWCSVYREATILNTLGICNFNSKIRLTWHTRYMNW